MSVRSVNRSGLRSELPVPNMLAKLQILLGSERKSGSDVSEFRVRFAVCQPVTRKAVLLRSSRWFYAKLSCKPASTKGRLPFDKVQYRKLDRVALKLNRPLSKGGAVLYNRDPPIEEI